MSVVSHVQMCNRITKKNSWQICATHTVWERLEFIDLKCCIQLDVDDSRKQRVTSRVPTMAADDDDDWRTGYLLYQAINVFRLHLWLLAVNLMLYNCCNYIFYCTLHSIVAWYCVSNSSYVKKFTMLFLDMKKYVLRYRNSSSTFPSNYTIFIYVRFHLTYNSISFNTIRVLSLQMQRINLHIQESLLLNNAILFYR